ncbi:decaprenyl-phosphate phosphoribosyltransferase [Propioniciclava sinopodophylli]|uniref:Decaprenyl-phosphate phosphoribosyltransferase n=1 Tax=Propioniciclava sinopodophylli TaxID=1837344 RepID=A0A4Q9KF71_9ACTN|nr:decaprenyl-phosphate phosphoribosyltransferase [Propioniciclava sinopodophylli]TBT86573.1 decaprenyl-phosphate phosphoribosyltransferase [Propioniciclava sinopodophylli]
MTELEHAHARHRLPAAIRAMRPRQWVKNILVFAAPVAAGTLLQPAILLTTLWAFVAFCLVSASIYLINDVRDVEADRAHPKKRFRPIAAGELSPTTALVLAGAALVASLGLGFWMAPLLGVTLATYWVLQVGYSLFLKNQPIIDLAMVASGFILRAVAGGVASGIELSQWFLLVAAFGSLFMVAGKRYSEIRELGAGAGTRASLARYTDSYLRFAWTVACTAVIMSYSLWAFEQSQDATWLRLPWHVISIAPFTLALLRYAYVIDSGSAGEPEDVVLSDRVLQALGLLWVVPVAIAVFF